MKSHKISTIVYAQGFVDGFIESETEPVIEFEGTEEGVQRMRDENEYKSQVREMWAIMSEGLDQIRKENASLENKLALIDLARNTET